ncbi:MAG: hypothetical protein FWD57_05960 [Polyangiaceae bacterium]|nr:hypothetical protein [Polyangiaceae bacterium]
MAWADRASDVRCAGKCVQLLRSRGSWEFPNSVNADEETGSPGSADADNASAATWIAAVNAAVDTQVDTQVDAP